MIISALKAKLSCPKSISVNDKGKRGLTKIGYLTLRLAFIPSPLTSIYKYQGSKRKELIIQKKEKEITKASNDAIDLFNKNTLSLNDPLDFYMSMLKLIDQG